MWCQKDSSTTPPTTTAAPTRRAGPTRSRSSTAASATAITTLVSRTAATGAGSASRSASSTSVGTEARDGCDERLGSELRPQSGTAPASPHPAQVEQCRNAEDELEVAERVGVLDPAVVGERVPGDAGRDREREEERAPVRSPEPAHEQHPGGDEDHAERLALRHGGCAGRKDQHRREPARNRVDDAQLRSRVRVREQPDIRELERPRDECVRPHLPLDVPRDERDGSEEENGQTERHCRRRLHVARPREDQVPGRVQHCRRER